MKLKKIFAHRVILVDHDQIPMSALITQTNIVRLKESLNFGNVEVGQNTAAEFLIRLTGGLLQSGTEISKIIELVINERKITMNVEGTTQDLERILDKLYSLLAEVAGDNSQKFLQPLIVTDESEIVAQLDFDFENLLAKSFNEFISNEFIEKAKIDLAEVIVWPRELRFELDYMPKTSMLKERNIQISKKEFIISPRPGFPLSERIFFSKAPVRTDMHISLLETLEKRLTIT